MTVETSLWQSHLAETEDNYKPDRDGEMVFIFT